MPGATTSGSRRNAGADRARAASRFRRGDWKMAATAATAPASAPESAGGEVSLTRLYVLRAAYALLVVGVGALILPVLVSHEPAARGVIPSLLGAVWVLAFIGLRYPLQMLP